MRCARCGGVATSDLWGQPACADCRAAWFASSRTSSGAVDASLGVTWTDRLGAVRAGQVLASDEYAAATSAAYRRLVDEWVRSAKRGAA